MSAPTLSVSAVLLSYNCAPFIEEALKSVLQQDYPSLDIFVSDDASQDETVRIIEEALEPYAGPHTITLNRRTHNSGSKTAHLNAIFPEVAGDLIVFFDGDDISSPRRIARLVKAVRDREGTQAAYSSMSIIDRFGRPLRPSPVPHPARGADSAAWFAKVDSYAAGGTLAVRRRVVDSFGPLEPEINEDVILPFRASLLGGVAFIDEPLVTARRHAASLTTNLDQYESMASYRARIEAGIAKARKKAAVRLADLAAAEELMPSRSEEFDALRQIVDASLNEAEMTRKLVSPSRRERMATLLKLIRAKAYPEQLAQHACVALAPALYLRYKRHMVARNVR